MNYNLINLDYENPISNALNIKYEKLMYNKEKYLNKNKHYYVTCEKGINSRRAAKILNSFGYNVSAIKK